MTDPKKPQLDDLLSSFALGPSWARDDKKEKKEHRPKRAPKSSDRFSGDNKRGGKFKGKGGKFNDRRDGPPQRELTPPEKGVQVTIAPDNNAVGLIVKEVQQVARVYPLFDVSKTLLADKKRCRAIFEAPEPHAPLYLGTKDNSLFLTKEEANRHLWSSELKSEYVEEEIIEVEPPKGNFQLVAKCGISGEWLGPPNFHNYQSNLRRLHREKFSNMPFERYTAKVKTERDEEAINAWLQSMTQKTRWRIKGKDDAEWIEDQTEAERQLSEQCFSTAFEETRKAELSGDTPPKNLSPSLLASLKLAGNHARKHPAMLIPAICKSIEQQHLPVFKRQGKLFTGPVRPHPLPADTSLAPRPAQMVEWIRGNKPAKLEGLWKALLPEGSTAPPADYAADLFWLLHQGHILLFTDDTLVVLEPRQDTPPKKKAAKKKKAKPKADEPKAEETTSEEPSPKLEVGTTAEEATKADITPEPPAAAMEVPPTDELDTTEPPPESPVEEKKPDEGSES